MKLKDTAKVIEDFRGEYAFLSNFYRHKFRYKGKTYRTAEHAFQAQKTFNHTERLLIKRAATPNQAKAIGQRVSIRDDWDLVKVSIMNEILRAKFSDPLLAHALISTYPAKLVEKNYWGDQFWGVCAGKGLNHLGRLLMAIRADLRRDK